MSCPVACGRSSAATRSSSATCAGATTPGDWSARSANGSRARRRRRRARAPTGISRSRIGALLDLRARGYDLAVVEVSPLAHTPAGEAGALRLPLRLWRLQRDAMRSRFEALGVPVASWEHAHTPLELPVEEVIAFRRHARPAPHA